MLVTTRIGRHESSHLGKNSPLNRRPPMRIGTLILMPGGGLIYVAIIASMSINNSFRRRRSRFSRRAL
jgi:hypothetical protein